MRSWIRRLFRQRQTPSLGRQGRPYRSFRPLVENLEERSLLANAFLQTNLVSDIAGIAQQMDPNLINPWGLAYGPNGPFWVADNNAAVSTLYTGKGVAFPPGSPLVVNIPLPNGQPGGAPTGIVFNGGNGFVVKENGQSGSAVFIFATEDGTIVGWSPGVDFTHAIIAVDNSATPTANNGAVYKGLAMGKDSHGRILLYATNFRSGNVDVFDSSFHTVTVSGGFVDPNLPQGFAPFGIQNIGGLVYVTYAMQDAAKHDDVGGAGNGFVDVFNTDGVLQQRLISQGPLDSPWGLAIAPADFGDFSNDLLVGNLRDGHINAFDPSSGAFKGTLADGLGRPVVIGGLWALKFGNGAGAGPRNTLFFSAGINGEKNGLFGSLRAINPITLQTGSATTQAPNAFFQTNLVSDVTGIAQNPDPHLQNPWGLTSFPGGNFWVSDNDTAVSTLYNGQGQPQSLVVSIPGPGTGTSGHPTGIDANLFGGFDITPGQSSTSSAFLFATLEGTIAGWNPSVNLHNAVTVVDNSASGASYTGLTIAQDPKLGTLLYAANSNGSIDVFDQNFKPVKLAMTAFQDSKLPAGFAPYNVENIGGKIYVTYSPTGGTVPGDGAIDVFSTSGVLLMRFGATKALQSPWGMALAPAGFGKFGGDLIVGNVDSGRIDAFDPKSGLLVGVLKDGLGRPITIGNIWGLEFGTGGAGGDPNSLFFNAGIGQYAHGLFGTLQAINPIQTV
jgi:uncharacterized protein (TIGR03118 family)